MSTVEERVKKIVCEQLGVKESEVQNSSSFVEDLGADSLDTVELVMALEEEFETEESTFDPAESLLYLLNLIAEPENKTNRLDLRAYVEAMQEYAEEH